MAGGSSKHVLAGGSRERPLISPRPAAFPSVRTIRHLTYIHAPRRSREPPAT